MSAGEAELHTYVLNILVFSDRPLTCRRIQKLLKMIYGVHTDTAVIAKILQESPFFVTVGRTSKKKALWTVKPGVREIFYKSYALSGWRAPGG